jgi:2-C-methyl-D-erythritol 2,4-cyclodiphosphate synthase
MNRAPPPIWRIGEGWDSHALVVGRKLVLGGVEIAHTHGLMGHSDADALCHAITDALFGAAAMGDIGFHFPDTDMQYKGADSIALLAECARRVRGAGWQIGNVDSTITAQAPKMAPHILAMRQRIAPCACSPGVESGLGALLRFGLQGADHAAAATDGSQLERARRVLGVGGIGNAAQADLREQ